MALPETACESVERIEPQLKLTKTRYKELVQIACELCEWLKEKGVKQHEQCQVRYIAEQVINLPD